MTTGSGVISNIKAKLNRRPKILNDLLKSKGDQKITNIEICRIPITSMFQKLLNLATLGKMRKKMKSLHYDKLYHLYLVVHLVDGSVYSIEKNQRVTVLKGKKQGGECRAMWLNSKKTLRQFIETAEKLKIPGFYVYRMATTNCQHFIASLMNANGIRKFNKFILQDVEKLAPGYIKKIANVITDTVAVGDLIIKGGGKR